MRSTCMLLINVCSYSEIIDNPQEIQNNGFKFPQIKFYFTRFCQTEQKQSKTTTLCNSES